MAVFGVSDYLYEIVYQVIWNLLFAQILDRSSHFYFKGIICVLFLKAFMKVGEIRFLYIALKNLDAKFVSISFHEKQKPLSYLLV